jgi:plastocyanin
MIKKSRLRSSFTAALLILAACGTALAQTTHMVTVSDNRFTPSELTIEPGDTVRWTNAPGGNLHDVTSNDGSWEASATAQSFVFEVTFNDAGEFDYRCTVHPAQMQGTITVTGAQASAEMELQTVEVTGGIFAPGQTMTAKSTYRNNGDAASAGATTLTYYLSTNMTINQNDTVIGTASLAGLAAGAGAMTTDDLTLPLEMEPGTYFIGAVIEFPDANTDNNTARAEGSFKLAAFVVNPGLNDVWFNEATAGQGFFFIVFPDIELFFLAWFTYDTERPDDSVAAILGEAGHRWVTAFGGWEGNKVTLEVELSAGMVFNSGDPPVEQTPGYGTMMIVFHDCSNATLTYNFPQLSLSGSIELTRITPDLVALCDAFNNQ